MQSFPLKLKKSEPGISQARRKERPDSAAWTAGVIGMIGAIRTLRAIRTLGAIRAIHLAHAVWMAGRVIIAAMRQLDALNLAVLLMMRVFGDFASMLWRTHHVAQFEAHVLGDLAPAFTSGTLGQHTLQIDAGAIG